MGLFSSISSLNTMVLVVCLRFFLVWGKSFSFSFLRSFFGGMQSELILNLFVLYSMFSLLGSTAPIASLIVNIPGIVGTKS